MSDKRHQCGINKCTKIYGSVNSLKSHKQRKHEGYSILYFEEIKANASYQCLYCDKMFTTQNNRNTHIRDKCRKAPPPEERRKARALKAQEKKVASSMKQEEKKAEKPMKAQGGGGKSQALAEVLSAQPVQIQNEQVADPSLLSRAATASIFSKSTAQDIMIFKALAQEDAKKEAQRPMMDPGFIIEPEYHCPHCEVIFNRGNSQIDMLMHSKQCELNPIVIDQNKESASALVAAPVKAQARLQGKRAWIKVKVHLESPASVPYQKEQVLTPQVLQVQVEEIISPLPSATQILEQMTSYDDAIIMHSEVQEHESEPAPDLDMVQASPSEMEVKASTNLNNSAPLLHQELVDVIKVPSQEDQLMEEEEKEITVGLLGYHISWQQIIYTAGQMINSDDPGKDVSLMFSCYICNYKAAYHVDLQRHVGRVHNQRLEMLYKCTNRCTLQSCAVKYLEPCNMQYNQSAKPIAVTATDKPKTAVTIPKKVCGFSIKPKKKRQRINDTRVDKQALFQVKHVDIVGTRKKQSTQADAKTIDLLPPSTITALGMMNVPTKVISSHSMYSSIKSIPLKMLPKGLSIDTFVAQSVNRDTVFNQIISSMSSLISILQDQTGIEDSNIISLQKHLQIMTKLMTDTQMPTNFIDMNVGKASPLHSDDTIIEVSHLNANVKTDTGSSCIDSLFEFSPSDVGLYQFADKPDELIDTSRDEEILAKTYLVNWDTITWHKSHTLDRLAQGLKMFTLNKNTSTIVLRGNHISASLLAQLLTSSAFCKLTKWPQVFHDNLIKQQVRETIFSMSNKHGQQLFRIRVCSFVNEKAALETLRQTTAKYHPQHEGACFQILDDKDPIWKNANCKWDHIRLRPRYACLSYDENGDIIPTVVDTGNDPIIEKDLEQDLKLSYLMDKFNMFQDINEDAQQMQQGLIPGADDDTLKELFNQVGGYITCYREEIIQRELDEFKDAQERKEIEIIKNQRMRTRQCKALTVENQERNDLQLRDQIKEKYKHLKNEGYEVLPADLFTSSDKEMIRKVLIDCHNARKRLRLTKKELTNAINKQFALNNGPYSNPQQQKLLKTACYNIRGALQEVKSQRCKELADLKQRFLTSKLFSVLSQSVLYQRFNLREFSSDEISLKEQEFTYQSPQIKGGMVKYGWSKQELKDYTITKKVILRNAKYRNRFNDGGNTLSHYIHDASMIIASICATFDKFRTNITIPTSLVQVANGNKETLMQLKQDHLLAQCFLQCSFDLLNQVQREKEMTKEMQIQEDKNNRALLVKRHKRKNDVKSTQQQWVYRTFTQSKHSLTQLKLVLEQFENVFTILEAEYVSVKICQAIDQRTFSHDIYVRRNLEEKLARYTRIKDENINQILNLSDERDRLKAELFAYIFIVYYSGKDTKSNLLKLEGLDQLIIKCQQGKPTSGPQQTVDNGSVTQPNQPVQLSGVSNNRDNAQRGDNGQRDNDEDEDNQNHLIMIDTSSNKDQCDFCNSSGKLKTCKVLLQALPANQQYFDHLELLDKASLKYLDMLLCRKCAISLSRQENEFKETKVKKIIETSSDTSASLILKREPHDFESLASYFDYKSPIDKEILRSMIRSRWALYQSQTNPLAYYARFLLHPDDQQDIKRKSRASLESSLFKAIPDTSEFKRLRQQWNRVTYGDQVFYEQHNAFVKLTAFTLGVQEHVANFREEMYKHYNTRTDTSIFDPLFEKKQRAIDNAAQIWQVDKCMICWNTSASEHYDARIAFIPKERLLPRFQYIDLEDKQRNHEWMKLCSDCRIKNEAQDKAEYLERCLKGYYRGRISESKKRQLKFRKKQIGAFVKVWGFLPDKRYTIKASDIESVELTNNTQDDFYVPCGRQLPLKVQHKADRDMKELYADYIDRKCQERRLDDQRIADPDCAWLKREQLKPDEKVLYKSLQSIGQEETLFKQAYKPQIILQPKSLVTQYLQTQLAVPIVSLVQEVTNSKQKVQSPDIPQQVAASNELDIHEQHSQPAEKEIGLADLLEETPVKKIDTFTQQSNASKYEEFELTPMRLTLQNESPICSSIPGSQIQNHYLDESNQSVILDLAECLKTPQKEYDVYNVMEINEIRSQIYWQQSQSQSQSVRKNGQSQVPTEQSLYGINQRLNHSFNDSRNKNHTQICAKIEVSREEEGEEIDQTQRSLLIFDIPYTPDLDKDTDMNELERIKIQGQYIQKLRSSQIGDIKTIKRILQDNKLPLESLPNSQTELIDLCTIIPEGSINCDGIQKELDQCSRAQNQPHIKAVYRASKSKPAVQVTKRVTQKPRTSFKQSEILTTGQYTKLHERIVKTSKQVEEHQYQWNKELEKKQNALTQGSLDAFVVQSEVSSRQQSQGASIQDQFAFAKPEPMIPTQQEQQPKAIEEESKSFLDRLRSKLNSVPIVKQAPSSQLTVSQVLLQKQQQALCSASKQVDSKIKIVPQQALKKKEYIAKQDHCGDLSQQADIVHSALLQSSQCSVKNISNIRVSSQNSSIAVSEIIKKGSTQKAAPTKKRNTKKEFKDAKKYPPITSYYSQSTQKQQKDSQQQSQVQQSQILSDKDQELANKWRELNARIAARVALEMPVEVIQEEEKQVEVLEIGSDVDITSQDITNCIVADNISDKEHNHDNDPQMEIDGDLLEISSDESEQESGKAVEGANDIEVNYLPVDQWSTDHKVKLWQKDFDTLGEGLWLNGEVINTYSKMINSWRQKHHKSQKVFACSSRLFSSINQALNDKETKQNKAQSQNKPMEVPIKPEAAIREIKKIIHEAGYSKPTDFDMLLIPIHTTGHWLMAVVDLKNSCITIVDSMGPYIKEDGSSESKKNYAEPLTEFFQTYFPVKSNYKFICKDAMVVQQVNNFDCGIMVILFMSALANNPSVEVLTKGTMIDLDMISWDDRRGIVKKAIQESRLIDIIGGISYLIKTHGRDKTQIKLQNQETSKRVAISEPQIKKFIENQERNDAQDRKKELKRLASQSNQDQNQSNKRQKKQ